MTTGTQLAQAFRDTLEGDSGDAEISAALDMADYLEAQEALQERIYDALIASGNKALADEYASANGGDSLPLDPEPVVWSDPNLPVSRPKAPGLGMELLHMMPHAYRFAPRPGYSQNREDYAC